MGILMHDAPVQQHDWLDMFPGSADECEGQDMCHITAVLGIMDYSIQESLSSLSPPL